MKSLLKLKVKILEAIMIPTLLAIAMEHVQSVGMYLLRIINFQLRSLNSLTMSYPLNLLGFFKYE